MSLTRCHQLPADLYFQEGFEKWLEARLVDNSGSVLRVRYISERTEWDYRQYARALGRFFGGLRLRDIHDGHLREFQRARACCDGAWARPAGQNRIRKEVALLLRMLRSAGLWSADLDSSFDQLPIIDNDIPRSLEPFEQQRLLQTMQSCDDWMWVYSYTVIALQTCASTNELRAIRLRDVALHSSTLRIGVEGSKNKYRNRTIPLATPEVLAAFAHLEDRARACGARDRDHYLFPSGANRLSPANPAQPMSDSGLKRTWNSIRLAANLPWLRPYDLRHTAITRMAEAGTPIAIIMSFAGHVSVKMQQHYTTISMQAKRTAAAAAWVLPTEIPAPAMDEAFRMPTIERVN